MTATHYSVDPAYCRVMDLSFADRLPHVFQRFASGNGVILNQVAASRLLDDGAAGLGDVITVGNDTRPVLGVIEGFRFRDLTQEIGPLALTRDDGEFDYLLARATPGDTSRVRQAAERIWTRTYPSQPFSSASLHETIAQRYLPYRDLMRVLALAGAYAVFVSCLGVMGMAAQSVEQRVGEIGIRKAVGATSGQIVRLLLRETAALTATATLIGIPLAAYLNSLWLSSFTRQADPGLGIYAWAVLLTATAALRTAATQAFRGAEQDVARSLRHPDS